MHVCQRPSQHMFDSDQIFSVCVEPPTQSSEGQLHEINQLSVLKDEYYDKWERGLMSNGLLSHAAFTIFSGGAHIGTAAHSPFSISNFLNPD